MFNKGKRRCQHAVYGKDKNPFSCKLEKKIIALLSIAYFVLSTRYSFAVSPLLLFIEDQVRIMVGLQTVFLRTVPGKLPYLMRFKETKKFIQMH